jgi:hypothetical protein
VSIYYKIYYKFVKQYATKSHDKERHDESVENEKTLEALSKSWFFREDRSNEKDTVRLPWQYLQKSHGGVCDEGACPQGGQGI